MQYSIKDLVSKLNKKIKNESVDSLDYSFFNKKDEISYVIPNTKKNLSAPQIEEDVWDTLELSDLSWAVEKLIKSINKEIEMGENQLNKVIIYNEPVNESILNKISTTLNDMSYRQFKDLVNKDARRNSWIIG